MLNLLQRGVCGARCAVDSFHLVVCPSKKKGPGGCRSNLVLHPARVTRSMADITENMVTSLAAKTS